MNIREFRGIKKCDKPLKFSEFTLLIGRNNSGKSSVLEALSLLPLPIGYSLPGYQTHRVGLLSNLHSGTSSAVYGYSGTASIEYTIGDTTWRIELKEGGDTSIFIDDAELPPPLPNVLKGVATALDAEPMEAAINKMVFLIPNDTSFMNKLSDALQSESNRNVIMKLGSHVSVAKDFINECVDDRYTEILLDSPVLRARKELPDGNVLYIKMKDLGDGVEKAALVTLWLDAIKPVLVLWDDFEASAHPTLVKVLLRWLCRKDWQVVLSTHSIDVLNSLLEVKPKNAKVMQLRKTPGDILIHHDLSLDELESLFDANQDPRILVDLLKL